MPELFIRPVLAAALAMGGFFAFSVSDALTRILAHAGYGIFMIAGVFQCVALGLLLAFHVPLGGMASLWRTRQRGRHLLRGALVALLVPMNIYAFSVLPFSQTYALLFTGIFWAILLARPLTGERIPRRQVFFAALGFSGAVLVLRPWQAGFDWRMLVPVVSAVFFALESLIARQFGKTETPLALAFYPCVICSATMLGAAWAMQAPLPPSLPHKALFALGGVMMGSGFLGVPLAFRYGHAALVGPFQYTQLIWAALLGFVLFGELPDGYTWAGSLLIAFSGLLVLMPAQRGNGSISTPAQN